MLSIEMKTQEGCMKALSMAIEAAPIAWKQKLVQGVCVEKK